MDPRMAQQVETLLQWMLASVEPGVGAQLKHWLPQYFAHTDPEEFAQRSPQAWFAALHSHWSLAQQRSLGQAQLRVLGPDSAALAQGGPQRTVIEVVNDDMPFLVDSSVMELNQQGLMLQLIVHPVLWVERDAQGQLLRVLGPDEPRAKAVRESWMHIEVDHLVDAQQREALHQGLVAVLADVRRAVSDWPAMQSRLRLAMQELAALASEKAGPAFVHELAETHAFLQWLLDDHFVLLGYRQHDLLRADDADTLRLVPGSDLGVLRASAKEQGEGAVTALPPRARALARATTPLAVVTKANTRSKVHRPGYTDYIGVKRIDADGQVVGEHRFVGLFTSTAYSARVFEVPLVRGKVQAVMQRAAALGIATGGHLGKALTHILEGFPRDELFQISPEMLQSMALEILRLGERQRLRLFVRPDPFDRYVSCLVFVPREAYSTELRRRFMGILTAAFEGASADFNVLLTDDVLARIHITVRTRHGQIPAYDRKALEQALAAAARRWDDELRDVLIERLGHEQGIPLARHWAGCFPTAYRERVSAREALHDVKKLAGLSAQRPLAVSLYPMAGGEDRALGFKVYRWGAPVVLSESLPMLERMGVCVFSENSYRIAVPGGPGDAHIWLHDFELRAQPTDAVPFEVVAQRFEQVFEAVYAGEVENDEFNRLALSAGLAVDEIVVLRAYAKYLKQMAFALSQSTIEAALSEHPAIARQLVELFKLRFDPQPQYASAPLPGPGHVGAREAVAVKAIEAALDEVDVLSEDRALRQLLGLMLATVRTNFWCTGLGHSGADGPRRSFLSFKLDSMQVPELPEPRPRYEIFVYSPRFEGIHLRGGKVARGGLRWSDRPEDFRTEVLGLVKAQMVKNTIIVPVGSKGGFVLKRLPKNADRETVLGEGIACYQDYLRALLDVTDNRVGEQVVTPPKVVRHDEPDPYLVVAADKGTASFSDQANAISAEYDFWLGDAFASGGSAGYDHKAMGITARGAWESVKRHFRELGVDTQSTDFTVAGIGDMSGDVFGNGMLLSRHIRLVAAFDHRHIFLDPNPDAAASFAQRERLFRLPRSSWADYDRALISAGGGVWARTEKSIALSDEARAALGIEARRLTPAQLVSAILRAPVDLLYNGGIGVYIKSSEETHGQVGDRANDAVRIDACELRVKVLAEGGNLGCTQRGRIEAAQSGLRLYTDAIDNSAGVDASDHEVNIKILLGLAQAQGRLDRSGRDALLAQMTDEVAQLVLRDNIYQTQVLSLKRDWGARHIDAHARLIRFLEKAGRLNRAIEYLPAEDEFAERKEKNQGLTAPELAVVLAYSKMWLYDELLASQEPEDPWVATALMRYFPQRLRTEYADLMVRHPLAREITATHVVNSMVNRVGPSFVHQLVEVTGASAAQVVRAYLLTREVYGLVSVWPLIEVLDPSAGKWIPWAVQAQMLDALWRLIFEATAWFVRSRCLHEPMASTQERFAAAVAALRQRAEPVAAPSEWIEAGVSEALAQRVAQLPTLFAALNIAQVAQDAAVSVEQAVEVHLGLERCLALSGVRARIAGLKAHSHWDSAAKTALADDLSDLQQAMARRVLAQAGEDVAARLSSWQEDTGAHFARAAARLAELSEVKRADWAMLSVALRELKNLV